MLRFQTFHKFRPLSHSFNSLILFTPTSRYCTHSFYRRLPHSLRSVKCPNSKGLMTSGVEKMVQEVHSTPWKAVFYVTGGAASALPWLLTIPGASRTVLEAVVPYAQSSTARLLGEDSFTSYSDLDHSRKLAAAAYRKAAELTEVGEVQLLGVAAACALATDRPKQGDHVCSVSIHGSRQVRSYVLKFKKGARDRKEEDEVSSHLLLNALAEASGVLSANDVQTNFATLLFEEERLESATIAFKDPVKALINGSIKCVEFVGDNYVVDAPRRGALILPGSFNPLHDGHKQLLRAAEDITGKLGLFEIAIFNADKGGLQEDVIRQRMVQFHEQTVPALFTAMPLFSDKAAVLFDSTFLIGYDTAARIIDAKYYENSETEMALNLEKIRRNGCRFLVAGRLVKDEQGKQQFSKLQDLEIPDRIRDLFQPLDDFRVDLSSTEIRNSQ